MLDGNRIRALRHAREIFSDMRWRGMTVPPIYTSMAEEFQALVRSGAYAAWVASYEKARREPKANPTATPLAHALASSGHRHRQPRAVHDAAHERQSCW